MCTLITIISITIILRREINIESCLFSLFLGGVGGYVFFYFFLQIESLKYLHYPLSLLSAYISTMGWFLFIYSLKNDGNVPKKIIYTLIPLYIPVIVATIMVPYKFVQEPTHIGYELEVDPWFLFFGTLAPLVYFLPACYWVYQLGFGSYSRKIRKKIKIILLSAAIMCLGAVVFLVLIPVLYLTHITKPIGYSCLGIGMFTMTLAFKKEEENW